jgi:hypothetical protein
MAQFLSAQHYNIDFRNRQVSINGNVQDYPGIAYLLGSVDFDLAMAIVRAKEFSSLSAALQQHLIRENYSNVTIIT